MRALPRDVRRPCRFPDAAPPKVITVITFHPTLLEHPAVPDLALAWMADLAGRGRHHYGTPPLCIAAKRCSMVTVANPGVGHVNGVEAGV